MQSCKGCQFLVHAKPADVCRATDHDDLGLRPTVVEQRAAGALCGPEAMLYAPTRWHRLRFWWTNGPI